MVKPTCSMCPGSHLMTLDWDLCFLPNLVWRQGRLEQDCTDLSQQFHKLAKEFPRDLWVCSIFNYLKALTITRNMSPHRMHIPKITTIGPGCALTNPLPHQCIVQCDDAEIFHQEQLLWLFLTQGVLSWQQDVSDTDHRFLTSALSNWGNVDNDVNIRINWTVDDKTVAPSGLSCAKTAEHSVVLQLLLIGRHQMTITFLAQPAAGQWLMSWPRTKSAGIQGRSASEHCFAQYTSPLNIFTEELLDTLHPDTKYCHLAKRPHLQSLWRIFEFQNSISAANCIWAVSRNQLNMSNCTINFATPHSIRRRSQQS